MPSAESPMQDEKQRLVLDHAETASQLSGDITVKALSTEGHSLTDSPGGGELLDSTPERGVAHIADALLGSVEEGARSELNSAAGPLRGHTSVELEHKRTSLMKDLASLQVEAKEATKAEWKATKLEKVAVTAKLEAVLGKISDVTRDLATIEDEILAEGEIMRFEHRLVEALELHEYAPVEIRDEEQRVRVSGAALVIIEADGVVSDLAAGLSDDLLRVVKTLCEKSGAQVVLASDWRRDVRMVRMLNAAAKRIEMGPVQMFTPFIQPDEGTGDRVQRRADEVVAFIQASRASVPWVCLDTQDLVSAEGLERPLQALNHVKIDASRGLTNADMNRVLNQMRAQAVRSKRVEGMQAVLQDHAAEAEIAFVMGTHHRLGEGSAVDSIRTDPRAAMRGRHKRGGKEPVNLLQKILRRDVHVPRDFPSVAEALEACGAVSGTAPFVTLRVTVAKGLYLVERPISAKCRVLIEAEAGCKPGDVVLQTVGAGAVISLVDEGFVKDPLKGGIGHGHITLSGVTIDQGLIDRAKYRANWIARVSEDNKFKETRGLYRRMLIDAKIFPGAAAADEACPSIEAAKERLADFYLEMAVQQMNKELDQCSRNLPVERWPRAVEAMEGSITLQRCRIQSEAGTGVYSGRTGAVRIEDGCEVSKCRAAGVVAAEGGSMEVVDSTVSDCGTFGAICSGGRMHVKGCSVSACKIAGCGASNGGVAFVDGSKVLSNGEAGLSCEHEGSGVRAIACAIEQNEGYGVTAQMGGRVEAKDCSIIGNRASGMSAGARGAHISASECTLAGNAGNGAVA
eukprot:CAMPEP_0206242520 /NCGR_PEP_ID=MMETSP0047_2-20121206/17103_1 /ASSEMBLY_ACC=CAM_ASM_000192 /TAXON_ID=195065 /ORGANISM="Chroomonas mesostigmatica_cf, Strain CCMP1168" /LENGTH=797 /DNA_ID=CAMNT_0053667549 /DNA_START=76 /DNA_END=2466 /DNA_ORIENTATION=-